MIKHSVATRRGDDTGFTLVELLVSMSILVVVTGIFTVSFTSLQQGIRRQYGEVDAQGSVRKAATILDRQVRYANSLNDPVTVNGSQYVEWQSGVAGGNETCTQWRVVLASKTLQWRQWVLAASAPTSPVPSAPTWTTVLSGIDTTGGSVFATPTSDPSGQTFPGLGESLTVAVPVQRQLAVNLVVASKPAGRASVADLFTAQNTTSAASPAVIVCQQLGRP